MTYGPEVTIKGVLVLQDKGVIHQYHTGTEDVFARDSCIQKLNQLLDCASNHPLVTKTKAGKWCNYDSYFVVCLEMAQVLCPNHDPSQPVCFHERQRTSKESRFLILQRYPCPSELPRVKNNGASCFELAVTAAVPALLIDVWTSVSQ